MNVVEIMRKYLNRRKPPALAGRWLTGFLSPRIDRNWREHNPDCQSGTISLRYYIIRAYNPQEQSRINYPCSDDAFAQEMLPGSADILSAKNADKMSALPGPL